MASHFLINTLLQRRVGVWRSGPNRFSGFQEGVETVETVLRLRPAQNTPLKQGVKDPVRIVRVGKPSGQPHALS